MDRIIAFDLWGSYAHYKKIFATTSALTYPIPVKTALYGMVGAIVGLPKDGNAYLNHFQPGDCRIGIQILRPLAFQRININLRAVFGPMKPTDNRKPTLMEFIYRPKYRIYFAHRDVRMMDDLRSCLIEKRAVFTPSLGLANLLADFAWVGEAPFSEVDSSDYLPIHSVIPRRRLVRLNPELSFSEGNRIVEVAQYALEMDQERNVLDRDDIILDQQGRPISAEVSSFCPFILENEIHNVILF